ncbi:MAG: DUF3431 domain-containing protein [Gammaproteobacteria bacterium]|nr:DUF3431 domain-containing protein [Gammaproteobacteria bacterium]
MYNKGPAITEIDWLPSNVEIIELPNVGCESHTYLYHMISKRNCLAEKTLFVPASFQSLYYKRGMMVVLMKWLPSYDYGFSCLPCVVDLKTDFNDFSLSRYQHSSKANHAIDTQLVQCADRPFGTWYEKNFNNLHVKLSGTQGMFFVTRDKIMAHDASEYCQLIAYVDKDRNPEAGHYMERAWTALYLGE